MSLFNVLGNGVSGLSAAQQALDVIGQNIANANTPGYSRQRADLVASQVTPVSNLYGSKVTLLNGVSVDGIERIKNNFIQATADGAVAKQSALNAQVAPLSNVQNLLNEPSDEGLGTQMDTFFNDWAAVANDPTSTGAAAGATVINDGQAVANTLNGLSTGVANEWRSQRAALSSVVDQANAAATRVADLNNQIKEGQDAGANVNSLLDERDTQVSTLTSLLGVSTANSDNGQFTVSLNGLALVSGGHAETISLNAGTDLRSISQVTPSLSIGNVAARPSTGKAAGVLSALTTDLPNLNDQLDGVATSLRDAVNTLHTQGYTLSGDPGEDFFSGTGAGDLAVAVTDPSQLAVASSAGAADGSNAQKIAALVVEDNATAVLGGPGPAQQYRSLTTGLGSKISGLNGAISTQDSLVSSAQSAVASDSGVSLDEELSNMLLFQRSYQASAKLVTAADDMLQTLIGMVR